MKYLSKLLFFLASFSILPPVRKRQDEILEFIEAKHKNNKSKYKRAISQYDCQAYFFHPVVWFLFNLSSIFVFVPLVILLLLRAVKKADLIKTRDISLFFKVPGELRSKFGIAFVKKPLGYLRPRDYRQAFGAMCAGGFRPYFWVRTVWKIAVYSELVDTYSPERVWVTQEMVFEASVMTDYLDRFGIKHINFQHGDNYFSIQIAFCCFHQFYVWDEFYIRLFQSLRIEVDSYHTFCALDRLVSKFPERNIVKYFGQVSKNRNEFSKVVDNLLAYAKQKQCELEVRLHPAHKQQFEIAVLTERGVPIEHNSIDPIDSMFESKFVCSEFSSVLYQASLLNKNIVIDNSVSEKFDIIKDLDVIFLQKLKHELLVKNF